MNEELSCKTLWHRHVLSVIGAKAVPFSTSKAQRLNFCLVRLQHIQHAGTMDAQCINALPSVERGIVRDSMFLLDIHP